MTISATTYVNLLGATAPRTTRDGDHITLALHEIGQPGAVYVTGTAAHMRAIRDAIDAALSNEPAPLSPGGDSPPAGTLGPAGTISDSQGD